MSVEIWINFANIGQEMEHALVSPLMDSIIVFYSMAVDARALSEKLQSVLVVDCMCYMLVILFFAHKLI